ncbi:Uncharacterized protein PBTT_08352 [Plasmodiophora brassicae]|uniref:Uncharacterized protein n=1 Tax=Plasmodiophora brassicae TaxID=37360 RepID=A0A0G4IYM3_PLABS|nr:hypothetical protein PBRA_007845 [Plasmodiophora brassicae]
MLMSQYMPDQFEELDDLFFDGEELFDENGDFEEEILDCEIELDEIRHGYILETNDVEQEPELDVAELEVLEQPLPDLTQPADLESVRVSRQAFDDLGLVPQAAVFQWIGNLECFVTEHSRFCEAYEPYTAQLHNGPFPGICCFTLSSNTNLDLDVERDDDGQTKIFIKNAYTTGLLGVIPSVFSVVLLPLLMGGIVRASGKIETLIHPDSCPPPFKLILSANLSMISTAHDFDDAITNALTQLRRWLKRPKGVFVTPELPANIQSIRKVLNRPKKWRSKAQQSQQLAQHPCDPGQLPKQLSLAAPIAKRPLEILPDIVPTPVAKRPRASSTSTMQLLGERRRARNRREIEECTGADLPRLMGAILSESEAEARRLSSRCSAVVERIHEVLGDYRVCRDPLSCLGRLIGTTVSLRTIDDRDGIVSGALQESWRVILTTKQAPDGSSMPVLTPILAAALTNVVNQGGFHLELQEY